MAARRRAAWRRSAKHEAEGRASRAARRSSRARKGLTAAGGRRADARGRRRAGRADPRATAAQALGHLPRAARRPHRGARRAAHRQGRAHALPARLVRAPREAAGQRDGAAWTASSTRSSPCARTASTGRPTATTGCGAIEAAGREGDHRAGAARGGRRVPDPRAQHREGAQPEGALARGHPHVPRPGRRARRARRRDFAHLFEEPAFITLGAAYEKRPRYSAGAYHPFVKRLEALPRAAAGRGARSARGARRQAARARRRGGRGGRRLKARGLQSPYLKNFVVARVNFLRFKKGDAELRLRRDHRQDDGLAPGKFNVEKVKARRHRPDGRRPR